MKIVKKELLFLIIVTFIFLLYTVFYPNIITNDMEIELGSDYTFDYECYNLFSDLSDKIVSTGNVDTSKIGNYKVRASVKYLFYNIKKDFIVKVVDKIPPDIELKGDNPAYVCPNKDYIEEGYTALDNYDGDITDKVDTIIGKDNILYKVCDSSFNKSEVKRDIIHEDKINPSIELKGKKTIYIYKGSSYTEEGYTAFDNCDGDITNKVVSTGDVDTNTIGKYKITYEVKDSSDNAFSIDREVIVIKRPIYSGDGIIYLTFDDGPSENTDKVLKILKKYDAKATFFVTGNNQKYNDSIRKAEKQGNTIALHTYTHDYATVYSSTEAYFNDLQQISDMVKQITGKAPKYIRFPGGSSNMVSANYSQGIMSKLDSMVHERGYEYFDWNCSSGDAASNSVPAQTIVDNSTNCNYDQIMLLFHDSSPKTSTVEALPAIIENYKSRGYVFKAISDDTPIFHHGVNN